MAALNLMVALGPLLDGAPPVSFGCFPPPRPASTLRHHAHSAPHIPTLKVSCRMFLSTSSQHLVAPGCGRPRGSDPALVLDDDALVVSLADLAALLAQSTGSLCSDGEAASRSHYFVIKR
eukprot:CAMPEP_0204118084 /NCGR_PEP_ID=MMETSP0361-20130328/6341_1 /ASSEMBLY_ACC=CAM_ASM_000343 /TAXON_ID=268821 /ORGANISM="Scrippsiella Hangoei, Strain SHTV-5" /LENGTH=119 /DNA_ID=CAMNT_0051069053 /DNA_START=290 /DNA_END=646 /DNA_ORIENTATION=+